MLRNAATGYVLLSFGTRPVTVGQRRHPNCPEAVIRLGSVSLGSAGEAQLFALGELGGWEFPE